MRSPRVPLTRRIGPAGSTRRHFLRASVIAGLGASLVGGPLAVGAAAGGTPDFATPEGFHALDEVVADANKTKNNEEGLLAWQNSYSMMGFVLMYQAHRDTRYLDRFIDHADHVLANRDSNRGVVDYRRLSLPAWSNPTLSHDGQTPLISGVETGMILWPFAHYVRTVLQTPELSDHSVYGTKAVEYLLAMEDGLDVHDWQWGQNDNGEGFYIFPKGQPYPWDGIHLAQNMALALGRIHIHLAAITGSPKHRHRAGALARTFKNDLRVDDGGPYVWTYQWTQSWGYRGWNEADGVSANRPTYPGNRRVEDLSHGAIDIDFAVTAFRHQIVFTGRDMNRFAATFTRNLLDTTDAGDRTVWNRIDGSGRFADPRDEIIAAHWCGLAPIDETVYDSTASMYERLGVPTGSEGAIRSRGSRMMGGAGYLNCFARGAPTSPNAAFPPR